MKSGAVRACRKLAGGFLSVCMALWLAPGPAIGAPTTMQQARTAVTAWLALDAEPLGAVLGRQVKDAQTHTDALQAGTYYVVSLDPAGFVIVPGDDLVEPIIAFSPTGQFTASTDNPLGALVIRDLTDRLREARTAEAAAKNTGLALQASLQGARGKWNMLLATGVRTAGGLATISDVRVAPFVQSKWSQDTTCWPRQSCYNYYTPPGPDGSVGNYYSGCVATAMAQLMRFHQYPTTGVGTRTFSIQVCGSGQSRSLRGGDGAGGAYDWANMPLDPDAICGSLTPTHRQAIGALCHDAGVAVNMDYCSDGSGAVLLYSADAFKGTFMYSNAIKGYSHSANLGSGLYGMANPNLDAGYPVLLGIQGDAGGHAVVCDGYGSNASTPYHHLNMGWWGQEDAWYNLPTVQTQDYLFDTVTDCIYNVYVTGQGEIISGRVTNASGQPIVGATVTARRGTGETYTDITDTHGIYALAKVPSMSTYTVSVTSAGCQFTDQGVTTGRSTDYTGTSGNKYGIDFVGLCGSAAPTVTAITPNCGRNTGSVAVTNLAGTGFQNGASVRLTKTGQPDIVATGITVVSATKITCTLNLSGKATGSWNVVVSNPDSHSGALPDGFFCYARGDIDHDGDVDLADFVRLQCCFNGPNRPPGGGCGDCAEVDFGPDGDVDLEDFLIFQSCFNGPNRPPACG
jgi:hypothetical protein